MSLFESPHPSLSGIDAVSPVDSASCAHIIRSSAEAAGNRGIHVNGEIEQSCLCGGAASLRSAGSLLFHDNVFSLWATDLGATDLGATESGAPDSEVAGADTQSVVGILDVRLSKLPFLSLSISGLTLGQFSHLREHLERVEGRFDPFDPLPEFPVRLSAALQFVELVGGKLCSPLGSRAREISHASFLEATAHSRKQDFMWNVKLEHHDNRIWSLEFPSRVFMEAAFRELSPSGEGFVLPVEVLRERTAATSSPLVEAITELGLSRIFDTGVLIFLYRRNAPDDLRNQDDDSFLLERIELARDLVKGEG